MKSILDVLMVYLPHVQMRVNVSAHVRAVRFWLWLVAMTVGGVSVVLGLAAALFFVTPVIQTSSVEQDVKSEHYNVQQAESLLRGMQRREEGF